MWHGLDQSYACILHWCITNTNIDWLVMNGRFHRFRSCYPTNNVSAAETAYKYISLLNLHVSVYLSWCNKVHLSLMLCHCSQCWALGKYLALKIQLQQALDFLPDIWGNAADLSKLRKWTLKSNCESVCVLSAWSAVDKEAVSDLQHLRLADEARRSTRGGCNSQHDGPARAHDDQPRR